MSGPRRRGAAGLSLLLVIPLGIAGCKSGDKKDERAAATSAMAKQIGALPVGEEREVDDGVFMLRHRVGATDPIGDGWHRARSTEGGFAVEMPLAFADFRVRSETADGVELRSHSIGTKTPGLLSWSATCIIRKDGTRGPGATEPGDRTETKGSPPVAHQRTIVLPDRVCMVIVEAQGTDPLPSEADRSRFLASFQITGKPTW